VGHRVILSGDRLTELTAGRHSEAFDHFARRFPIPKASPKSCDSQVLSP